MLFKIESIPHCFLEDFAVPDYYAINMLTLRTGLTIPTFSTKEVSDVH